MLTNDRPATALVAVAGLSKRYELPSETVTAVDNVELTVGAGDLILISGPSGSGKSTLLSLIAGIEPADEGKIEIDGRLLADDQNVRAEQRLTTIGVVFQEDLLIDEFTAGENVSLPLEARGMIRADAVAETRDALSATGIDSLADRFPKDLSGGQRQRIGIARAIAGGRRLLLADEPTGALDSTNSLECLRLIRSLCDEDRAAIVCSHDPQAERFADAHYEMVDGKLSRLR